MLRSDGTAAACGDNGHGQCDVPALEDGLTYTHVAAGGYHTVLLRSDGTAAACGDNVVGQCDVPALEDGLTYTHVAAGGLHTAFLKSDGTAAACSLTGHGQCDVPAPEDGQAYSARSFGRDLLSLLVLALDFVGPSRPSSRGGSRLFPSLSHAGFPSLLLRGASPPFCFCSR